MIIGQIHRDIQSEGIEDTKKMQISASEEVQDHIIKLLTENGYQRPIPSLVREVSCNGIDSHRASGKEDVPVKVRLYKNETGNCTFEVADFGNGLNEEEFYKYCMNIGESTKRNSNNLIGAMGAGFKSPLAYCDSFEVILRKDNKEVKFLIFKGTSRPEATKIYEIDSERESGVIVKIPVGRWDFDKFKEAIKEQLPYFPTLDIKIEGDNFDYNNAKIFGNELFEWSEIYPASEMHISFGGCVYPINYEILGINTIYIPIAIKVGLEEKITPIFNRESLIYNQHTIQLIKDKIGKVAQWFVEKYNSITPDQRELLEAWDDINNTSKYVKIVDEEFCIDGLLKYTNIQPKELKIKGLEVETPKYYYDKRYELGDEYECVVDYSDKYNRKWKTKHVRSNHDLCNREKKHILVNRIPTGKLKEFLLNKHSGKLLFIKKTDTRKLGGRYITIDSISYKNVLSLVLHPKQEWRKRIQEFQFVENQFKSLIIDETNCENTPEYLNWLQEQKKLAKLNRKNGNYSSKSNYVRINKQAGDITIQVGVKKLIGDGCKFVKKAVKITDLNKLYKNTHALHIYFPEEQKERAKEFYELLGAKYSVCILSPREIKRLQEIKPKQFMTEKSFIESTKFAKIMTSLKYEKAIDNFDEIYRNSQYEIIDKVLEKFRNQRKILKEYTRKNGKNVPNNLLEELKEVAELHNLYDHSLDDVYSEFVKNTEKYEFISCLKRPNSWEDEEVAKYRKLINSLLLMKKKYGNFEELEIEVKPKQEETILEEQLEIV